MRRLYFVTYDICSPRRWRHVFKIMKSFGHHVQLSVFRCDLTDAERVMMSAELKDEIAPAEDQVLIVDLGPTLGRNYHVTAIGRPVTDEVRGAKFL